MHLILSVLAVKVLQHNIPEQRRPPEVMITCIDAMPSGYKAAWQSLLHDGDAVLGKAEQRQGDQPGTISLCSVAPLAPCRFAHLLWKFDDRVSICQALQ